MIDPEWLIEENRLESRSQSMQTFSNSSVALDEFKKLIETGAAKEDLLDTLVTNLNTEANQQIHDPEIVSSKKFQSEILLPTFISSHHGFEFTRGNSRRSLHPHYEEQEYHESLELQVNEKTEELELEMVIQRSGVHGSRLSFNEKLLIKPLLIEKLQAETKRRNTLDATHKVLSIKNATLVPSPLANDNPYKPTTVPKNTVRNRHVARKQVHLNPVGNLKNIQSLKYSNYLKNMKNHRHHVHHRGNLLSAHKNTGKASSCPNIYRNSMMTIEKEEEVRIFGKFFSIS